MPPKPREAGAAVDRGKCELRMPFQSRIAPRGGITKAFAHVKPPGRVAAPGVVRGEPKLAPLRAPAQFAGRFSGDLPFDGPLPVAADGVGEANPGEMKYFMHQDALKFPALREHFGIEQDKPAANKRRGQMRPQRPPDADFDGAAGKCGKPGNGFPVQATCRCQLSGSG
jgi:hypothetical protein